MNTNITIWYFILITTISILEVTAKTNNVIHEIGSQLCPYTSFCQRNATPYYDPGAFQRPCCSECSCEENCWEIANCCPDKDIIETQEPITKCIADVVKKTAAFGRARFGYHVIDYCPMPVKNVTLVNKCTIKQAASFEELIWVSDDISGKIYRNKFCAECHLVTSNVKEWSLEAKCTSDVYASLDNLESFFLSNKCQLTNREPDKLNGKLPGCEVPKYTTCNETGLWKNFDADVKWACNTFEAPFFRPKATKHRRVRSGGL